MAPLQGKQIRGAHDPAKQNHDQIAVFQVLTEMRQGKAKMLKSGSRQLIPVRWPNNSKTSVLGCESLV